MTNPIRVLLVDDHQVVRRGIREFLEEPGDIQVIAEAENAAQALALAASTKPDVIVLDIKLPDQSGIEVARIVRAQSPAVGVLILTAYDDDPYVEAALEANVNGYVMKSADAGEIIAAVRAVHEGQQAFNVSRQERASHPQQLPDGTIIEPLTARELEVLRLAAEGLTNKAIAYRLSISDRTVQGHLANIYRKLDVSGRTEMVTRAIQLQLLSLGD
ncbi:MAG: response regulator transcription factor [Anaerolineae bacterium]